MTPEQHPTQRFDPPAPAPRPLAYSEVPDGDPYSNLYDGPDDSVAHLDRRHLGPASGFNPHAAAWGEDRYPDPQPHTTTQDTPALSASCDAGVDLLRFIACALVTAIVAALVAILGVFVANAATQRWTPATYWIDHALPTPTVSGVGAVALSVGAALLAAGVMWVLLNATPAAGGFFCALGVLVTAIAMLLVATSGPWQTTLGPAVIVGMVSTAIIPLTCRYARLTTTRPGRF